LAIERAASALLLLLPETPLLFMGQEWAASTPFLYFTDHEPELGRAVTAGRRAEFGQFRRFADPEASESIPDPQALETFAASTLRWDERTRAPHAATLRLYRRLLELRRTERACRAAIASGAQDFVTDWDGAIVVRRAADGARTLLVVARLRGQGRVHLGASGLTLGVPANAWTTVLTTEDPAFADDAVPIVVDIDKPEVHFSRPGAVILAAPSPRGVG
jgi:maltooligosyltrehalose trehalohydrolase